MLKRSPATVNNALAAVDDFYIRHGLGPASAARVEISPAAPRALDHRAQLRYLLERDERERLVARRRAGLHGATPARGSARSSRSTPRHRPLRPQGVLRILGKGERVRQVPIHPQLHAALNGWLAERADRPGASDTPALFLNQRGHRLSVRGAYDIITNIATAAGLDDATTVEDLQRTDILFNR